MLRRYFHQFGRKLGPLEPQEKSESRRAPLNTLNLVILGVGKILRAAIYILIGKTVKYITGPAIVICFLVAALFSLLSGFCYAELWARVPRSGSVYLYSYVTMGQLYAFITGWNLILSLVLGLGATSLTASLGTTSLRHCKELSLCTCPTSWPSTQTFWPWPWCCCSWDYRCWEFMTQPCLTKCSQASTLWFRASSSSRASLRVTCTTGSSRNRTTHRTCLNPVAPLGEEALNAQWSIPLGITFSIFICFLAYFSVSASLTLILPCSQIQPDSPLSQTFLHSGWVSARYVLSVGIICAITYRLHSAMFPMSQVIYAMAEDGLLFRALAQVRARTDAPIVTIMSSGNLAGAMALLFKLSDLVDFLSVVTLLAYTLVAFSVLVLRYKSHLKEKTGKEIEMEPEAEGSPLDSVPEVGTSNILKSLWFPTSSTPTEKSGRIVYGCAFLLVLLLAILSPVLAQWPSQVFSGDPVLTAVAVLLPLLITGVTAIIWRQPQNPSPLYFKVPALPVLPLVSIFVNIYSLMRMTTGTWALFGIWMVVGFVIYFGYGIQHSLENNEPQPPASTLQT